MTRQANSLTSNVSDMSQTIVLIVDRREDVVTPLLNQVKENSCLIQL